MTEICLYCRKDTGEKNPVFCPNCGGLLVTYGGNKMKSVFLIFLIVVISLSCSIYDQTTRNVYLCLGQSNATAEWASGISDVIKKQDPEAIIIHSKNYGRAIEAWAQGKTRIDAYDKDIEKILDSLSGVDNFNIKALFWFQGESDAVGNRPFYYEKRFISLMSFLIEDLGDNEIDAVIHYVWHNFEDQSGLNLIRSTQMQIVNKYQYIYGFETRYFDRADKLHLSTGEQYKCGKQSAMAYFAEVN